MKRALVSYSSSSSDESEETPVPPPRKKKLPPLAPSLRPQIPIDNPALHRGRTRTSPHVEGQFAAYIYIPVFVEAKSPLGRLVSELVTDTRQAVPGLYDIGIEGGENTERELHISLSRPTYLRAHQREDLKRAIKALARCHSPFKASFATFSELVNDERTRTFLTLEVGAGHNEFSALTEALSPTLRSIRQKEFYTEPRFHASIAWALLDSNCTGDPSSLLTLQETLTNGSNTLSEVPSTIAGPESTTPPTAIHTKIFPSIPHLPASLIPALNAKYISQLTKVGVGVFDVTEVRVKIGKWVGGWVLEGPGGTR